MLGFVVREINMSDNVKKIEDLQDTNFDAKIQGDFKVVLVKSSTSNSQISII